MKKRLSGKVSNLLEKAKESALLAVDIYNKPRTSFRAGGFVVLMCIAWVSLLHAIFEKQGKKYFYRDEKNPRRFKKIDGEYKGWGVLDSATEFYKNADNPVVKNISFFCELRNKIEHRFMPIIDPIISGECQSLLLNFEELIVQEFGDENSIIENLFIPLQFTAQRKSLVKTKQDEKVIDFIKTFRGSLSADISDSQKFSFKAFFIPKLGSHRNSSDVAVEYVKFDSTNSEEMKKYEKFIVGIKEKTVQVANQGKYKPSKVLELVKEKTKHQTTTTE
jgi:ABC-type cobalt transport system substrate-binding protein